MSDLTRCAHVEAEEAKRPDPENAEHLRGSATKGRFVTALVPAAAMTFGLFIVMNGLIQIDEVRVDTSEKRALTVLTPQKIDKEKLSVRERPTKIKTVAPPPPPVREVMTREGISLPPVHIAGTAPALPDATRIIDVMTGPVAIANRTATPVRPPVLSYPVKAQTDGIEGDCKVYFNVSVRGEPYDIRPDCTHAVFEREAKRAVSRTQFLPKVQDGQSVELSNVMYPLSFRLEQ